MLSRKESGKFKKKETGEKKKSRDISLCSRYVTAKMSALSGQTHREAGSDHLMWVISETP